jgi:hypothetical protein
MGLSDLSPKLGPGNVLGRYHGTMSRVLHDRGGGSSQPENARQFFFLSGIVAIWAYQISNIVALSAGLRETSSESLCEPSTRGREQITRGVSHSGSGQSTTRALSASWAIEVARKAHTYVCQLCQ